jgi:hypothetical protein
MVTHICKLCDFSSKQKTAYTTHLQTQKHKIKILESKTCQEKDTSGSVIFNKIIFQNDIQNEKIDNLVKQNETVLKQNETVLRQNEELKNKIEELEKSNRDLKDANNQNTNKIVKEARAIKKSILSILNTNFKDTPSIDYIEIDEFKRELEREYKKSLDDPEHGLIMRIFSDYENKKLVQTLSSLILKFIKKEDQNIQPVFNIDSARGNYATKIEDTWMNDKSGLQLKKYTLDMVIKHLLDVLNIFGQHLEKMIKLKIKTAEHMEYIMKYQTIFLEVRAYLTNVNTHKRVILFMCPELRLDQKLLDKITS